MNVSEEKFDALLALMREQVEETRNGLSEVRAGLLAVEGRVDLVCSRAEACGGKKCKGRNRTFGRRPKW
ncbi:MAG: hypothetical protein HYV63_10070 [Candidatus Schekmanbacteria bacterium]|nr:hypothetical protein [Candidatus Schekmanbacteria bacterium]